MWRALRWVIWYAVNFYDDIKDEIRRVGYVRGNKSRYLSARRDLWDEYSYYDYSKGWMYAKAKAPFPPPPDAVRSFEFSSLHESLEATRHFLECIEPTQ